MMTEKEALVRFEYDKIMIKLDPTTGEELSLESVKSWRPDSFELYKAIMVSIRALKKRIPREPYIYGDGFDVCGNFVYDMYDCPACGSHYETEYDDYDYCPKCGQAFDWSKIKNKG